MAPTDGNGAAAVPRRARPATAPDRATDPDEPPLRGIRVLDFTTVWSGPYLTQLLADLGAEVIRVENPSVFPPTTKGYLPRPTRRCCSAACCRCTRRRRTASSDRPYNRHAMNNSIARNKLSCTLDPRRPEGRELLMRLVEQSDVFVENLKTSTLHQIGIHESQLLDRNPRMLVLRIPPAGLTGDWANYTGFGAQFDGLSGFAHLIGHHDSEMVETPPTMYMDAATGPAGAFAVLAALHYRAATGRGQLIELAQIENAMNQLGDAFVEVQLGGEPKRTGQPRPRTRAAGRLPVPRRGELAGDHRARRRRVGRARPQRSAARTSSRTAASRRPPAGTSTTTSSTVPSPSGPPARTSWPRSTRCSRPA